MTANILFEVSVEREKQKQVPELVELDKTNSINDYVAYISAYAGRAAIKVPRNVREGVSSRDMLVKVAALAVAAIESIDRKAS